AASAMLRVWMQDSIPPTTRYLLRPGRWVGEDQWPSPHVEEHVYPLAPGYLAKPGETPPVEPQTVESPLTVGLFAGKWCSYSATPDLPHDQREEDGGSLVFQSEPLAEPVEILGGPVLELELAASKSVAMVAARLSDVAPNGKATRITYGLLNLTHANGHARPAPIEPGKHFKARVQLNGVAQHFPAGHRIRVSLSTSYWPLAWAPPEPVRLTISTGSSSLTLPVRPPREADEHLPPFKEPAGAQPIEQTQLTETQHNWRVIRDLASDWSTLEVVKDKGTYLIDEIDLQVRSNTLEWYSSRGDDFNSLRGETSTVRGFSRGDWSTRTITRTVLTSTPRAFVLYAELDAYEGDKRVFSKNWDRTIPRDLV
ncbi:MAG: CocE/NonD family hydrolase C-terminal non-catalytic domain-containing protein, partial [Phycisphaeraceae bacterium]